MNYLKSPASSSLSCPSCKTQISKDLILQNAGKPQTCPKCKNNLPLHLIFSLLDSRFDKTMDKNKVEENKKYKEMCGICKLSPICNTLYCCENKICDRCLIPWLKNSCSVKDDGLNSLLCSFCNKELSMKLLKHLSNITVFCEFCRKKDNSHELNRFNCCKRFSCYECFKFAIDDFYKNPEKILKCWQCDKEVANQIYEAFLLPNLLEENLLAALKNEKTEELKKVDFRKELQNFYSKKTTAHKSSYSLFCQKCSMNKLDNQLEKFLCIRNDPEHDTHIFCKSCIKFEGKDCQENLKLI